MIREGELQWISSAGGPLVLLQRSSVSSWTGAAVEDYGRAGAIRGHLGVIKQGELDAVVLWGEPLETAYYANFNGQFLVRWSYGPDDEAVLRALERMDARTMDVTQETVAEIVDDRQVIIDAASSGDEASEQLPLDLAPGRYTVTTSIYRPSTDIELVVHCLLAR